MILNNNFKFIIRKHATVQYNWIAFKIFNFGITNENLWKSFHLESEESKALANNTFGRNYFFRSRFEGTWNICLINLLTYLICDYQPHSTHNPWSQSIVYDVTNRL